MTKREKLLAGMEQNPKGWRYDQVKTILERHGFTIDSSGGGSHRVFRHESGARAVIPDAGSGTLKPAYVKMVLQAIKEVTNPSCTYRSSRE